MQREGQRLTVVMPPPDDECFGCASTIAHYSAEEATVSPGPGRRWPLEARRAVYGL